MPYDDKTRAHTIFSRKVSKNSLLSLSHVFMMKKGIFVKIDVSLVEILILSSIVNEIYIGDFSNISTVTRNISAIFHISSTTLIISAIF